MALGVGSDEQKPAHRIQEEVLTAAEFEELAIGSVGVPAQEAKRLQQCEINIAGEQGKGYRQVQSLLRPQRKVCTLLHAPDLSA